MLMIQPYFDVTKDIVHLFPEETEEKTQSEWKNIRKGQSIQKLSGYVYEELLRHFRDTSVTQDSKQHDVLLKVERVQRLPIL